MKTDTHSIESLEPRIAPAAVLHYIDNDGDLATLTVSKGTNAQLSAICTFSDPTPGNPRTLREIDFSADAATYAGVNLTLTVKRGPGITDGQANVGFIDARTLDGDGAPLNLGKINIAGDLGKIEAGAGSATVPAVKSLTVRSMGRLGTSTQAAGGDLESEISGDIGALKIKGDFAGAFLRGNAIDSLAIGGSIIGGNADDSGRILLVSAGTVKIGGSILGGAGAAAGRLSTVGEITSFKIGGSLVGGAGSSSGSIAAGDLGVLKIAHDVAGGLDAFTGYISASSIARLSVGGSLVGGSNGASGEIKCTGTIGPITIGHDIIAGTLGNTGAIVAKGLTRVTVGGSLLGGAFENDPGDTCGAIVAGADGISGAVIIAHDVRGASTSGGISATLTGAISSEGRIGSVVIGGDLTTGLNSSNGAYQQSGGIFSGDNIGSVTIGGSAVGHALPGFAPAPVIIAARGQVVHAATTDVAIGKITIGGRAERLQILAGYDETLAPLNADAQIGKVIVGGDWVESSIAAGSINLGNDDATGGTGSNADNLNFGNAHDFKIGVSDDAQIVSRIAKVTIGGQIIGTQNLVLDRFGFVAEEIAAFKVGDLKVLLTAGANNDGFIEIGPFNDVRIHEVLTP